MSEELEFFDSSAPPPAGGEMTAIETWIAALTKPTESTFAEIAAQRGASVRKAFLWAALSSLMTSFATILANVFSVSRMGGLGDFLPPEIAQQVPWGSGGAGLSFGTLICGLPIIVILTLVSFAVNVGLTQWVAKMFGGTGGFEKLAYVYASFIVPISAVSAVLIMLGFIPIIGILFSLVSLGVSIYSLVLSVIAVKAVNNFDTGKAVGSIFLPGLVIFIFICCCVVVVGVLMGPAIGEAFNQVNQGLY